MEIKHDDIIFLLGYLFFGNYNDNTLYSCVFPRFKFSRNLAERAWLHRETMDFFASKNRVIEEILKFFLCQYL